MSFHLTPTYHNNWFPFRGFNNDLRLLRNLVDVSDPASQTCPTVEPSYSYEADDKSAHFEIEMPGVAKENLSVEINGHKLIVKGRRFKKNISGQVQEATEGEAAQNEDQQTVPTERTPSLVYLLEARLGHGADLDAIKADHCGDGILTVHIPMKTEKGARRIEIGL